MRNPESTVTGNGFLLGDSPTLTRFTRLEGAMGLGMGTAEIWRQDSEGKRKNHVDARHGLHLIIFTPSLVVVQLSTTMARLHHRERQGYDWLRLAT